jgi:hypothetical protein
MAILTTIRDGLIVTLRAIRRLLAWLFRWLREKLHGRRKRHFKEVCCFKPPADIRARPDPYIYCQSWLRSRNIAITWDNPDFQIIEVATGNAIRAWRRPATFPATRAIAASYA